ncbi:MAG: lamin tail domain-containing protein [Acidimicrobiia bacterium]
MPASELTRWGFLGSLLIWAIILAACAEGGVDESVDTTRLTTTTTTRPATTTTTSSVGTTTTLPVVPGAEAPDGMEQAIVVSVLDGDTLDVRLPNGTEERVRLIGTNAPEGGECFAAEATDALSALVLGQAVWLETDTSDRDQYGRLLRHVWTTDGMFVNAWTVAEGYAIARDYPPDTARSNELHSAQQQASESGLGLWANNACGPADTSYIIIAAIEYDAPGDDNQNLNGEWVDIQNLDDVVVDLTGWVLKDESATHRFRFPPGTTLEPGATITVFTGCGSDTTVSLYWCNTGSAVWNNSGDTAFLLDPAGNVVYTVAYDN